MVSCMYGAWGKHPLKAWVHTTYDTYLGKTEYHIAVRRQKMGKNVKTKQRRHGYSYLRAKKMHDEKKLSYSATFYTGYTWVKWKMRSLYTQHTRVVFVHRYIIFESVLL